MAKTVLEVKDYSLSFETPEGEVKAVRGANLDLGQGEILALVGESGCGKTVFCKSMLKLLPGNAKVRSGQVILDGQDITSLSERQMQKIRGRSAAMIFQDPMTSLNPTIPVGRQIMEAVLRCEKISRDAARKRAIELMKLVGIEQVEERFGMQPHFFSGGMRQRCVIAVALAANPKVLFADEPTTALDVTVQAKMLDLLLEVREKTGISIVFVSHDLGVVARIADRVAVMYAGRLIEMGTAEEIFYHPAHPYTWSLLAAMPSQARRGMELYSIPGMPPSLLNIPRGDLFTPRNPYALKIDFTEEPPMFSITETHQAATWLLDGRAPKVSRRVLTEEKDREDKDNQIENEKTILEVRGIKQYFPISRHFVVKAVEQASFSVKKGSIFGLVGESGCGKSTLARSIMGLYQLTDGTIDFRGKDKQIIFQDSAAALNPRMTVLDIIAEPIRAKKQIKDGAKLKERIAELLYQVGLDTGFAYKRPGEISGGQRQRVAIARSISTSPDLIVADEPIASLDLSIQAQILNLFQKLQKEYGFTFLFIAHDLSVVRHICDEVGVMLRGKIVEIGETERVFSKPQHPYTKALLSAVPIADPKKERQKTMIEYDPQELEENGRMRETEHGHWVYGNGLCQVECL